MGLESLLEPIGDRPFDPIVVGASIISEDLARRARMEP
jgi:hypothetical protein